MGLGRWLGMCGLSLDTCAREFVVIGFGKGWGAPKVHTVYCRCGRRGIVLVANVSALMGRWGGEIRVRTYGYCNQSRQHPSRNKRWGQRIHLRSSRRRQGHS